MKKIILLTICFASTLAFAHNHHTHNNEHVSLKKWSLNNDQTIKEGSFLLCKEGEVYIEGAHQEVIHFPLSKLNEADQKFVLDKNTHIASINKSFTPNDEGMKISKSDNDYVFYVLILLLAGLSIGSFVFIRNRKVKILIPTIGIVCIFFGFTQTTQSFVSNPITVDSAFAPFKNQVNTRWDSSYFYVETNAMAKHEMMVGITGWQQQVPIPQCYFGANAWSIPLNPEIASTPVPVNSQHFLKGAIAVAVNGIAIFNPYTNTGVDAFLDGQLDQFGGHTGRADDYHYHTAPTHLYSKTSLTLPIAYALDGFAVYGSKEPNGENMKSLDANHGHYGSNGLYHYHASGSAPYMIANMVGKVTEDADLQIIPQAQSTPLRPAQTPLKGAVITSNVPYANGMGSVLSYTLNNQTYELDYNWDKVGNYTFNLISPTGTTTTNYKLKTLCNGITTALEVVSNLENSISVYPNPASDVINIQLDKSDEKSIKSTKIYSLNNNLVYQSTTFKSSLPIDFLTKGSYLIVLELGNSTITKKLIVK